MCAQKYAAIAQRYDHDCIFVWHPFTGKAHLEVIAALRNSGGTRAGNSRAGAHLPYGGWSRSRTMCNLLCCSTKTVRSTAGKPTDPGRCPGAHPKVGRCGADVAYLPNDVAFNDGPYFSPAVFDEIVLPYAANVVRRDSASGDDRRLSHRWQCRQALRMHHGYWAHALQSIDPMAGMDISA